MHLFGIASRWRMGYGPKKLIAVLVHIHLVLLKQLIAYLIWFSLCCVRIGYGWSGWTTKFGDSSWGRNTTITYWSSWEVVVLLNPCSDFLWASQSSIWMQKLALLLLRLYLLLSVVYGFSYFSHALLTSRFSLCSCNTHACFHSLTDLFMHICNCMYLSELGKPAVGMYNYAQISFQRN